MRIRRGAFGEIRPVSSKGFVRFEKKERVNTGEANRLPAK